MTSTTDTGAAIPSQGQTDTTTLTRTSVNGRYQLLPPLAASEYAALRHSIRAEGIRVPIHVDQDGHIIDGHHRAAIAAELGIECPRVVSKLDSEQAKRTAALSLNLSRRHLNREQMREVVAASIAADPGLSDREHARRLGCSPTTVGTVRRHAEAAMLAGRLRDDADVENALRRLVPQVPNAGEQLAEVISDTADRVRARLRAIDRPRHDQTLTEALARYGIDGVLEYTAWLPWMSRSEFDRMAESATARGWHLPVVVTRDDANRLILVDGRCRLVASMREGVPACEISEHDLKDPALYSFVANVARPSITPDERAALRAQAFPNARAGERP